MAYAYTIQLHVCALQILTETRTGYCISERWRGLPIPGEIHVDLQAPLAKAESGAEPRAIKLTAKKMNSAGNLI